MSTSTSTMESGLAASPGTSSRAWWRRQHTGWRSSRAEVGSRGHWSSRKGRSQNQATSPRSDCIVLPKVSETAPTRVLLWSDIYKWQQPDWHLSEKIRRTSRSFFTDESRFTQIIREDGDNVENILFWTLGRQLWSGDASPVSSFSELVWFGDPPSSPGGCDLNQGRFSSSWKDLAKIWCSLWIAFMREWCYVSKLFFRFDRFMLSSVNTSLYSTRK